jgi:phosphoribosylamine-glycine ligase
MNILVVGSGGREHALVKALKSSSHVKRIWAWPGNDGIFQDAESVPVQRNQFQELSGWCLSHSIDLVVIGPEAELVAGLSDQLRSQNINVFGPSKEAAMLEGSKIFAKEFMNEFAIPTSRADVVTTVKQTLECAAKYQTPYVLKADGLVKVFLFVKVCLSSKLRQKRFLMKSFWARQVREHFLKSSNPEMNCRRSFSPTGNHLCGYPCVAIINDYKTAIAARTRAAWV